MRTTGTCPKCSGKKIAVVELRQKDRTEGPAAIPVVGIRLSGLQLWSGFKFSGRFESWICAACGYTELYAKDLGDVDALAAQYPEDVRIVDSAVPVMGPFR